MIELVRDQEVNKACLIKNLYNNIKYIIYLKL